MRLIKKKNLKELSDLIIKLDEDRFVKLFGLVPLRYLSKKIGIEVNNWIKKKNFIGRKLDSLHYLSNNDLIIRNDLNLKQYCIYFRCVRPVNPNKKISFPHRDYDFWKVETPTTYPNSPFKINKRHKLWIPIWNCNQKNSLRMIAKSHKKKITVKYLKKGKNLKPIARYKKTEVPPGA